MSAKIRSTRARALRGASFAVLACALAAGAAHAQTAEAPAAEGAATDAATAVSDIIVTGRIAFRNRTAEVNPVLSYDLDYFQRFEPVSVGEMVKRVPGVTFTSDVLEFDGVSMRGLPPGYTQILINGRRAPGGENDRSFFVDRIPAELVERVEIIRSPRADQPSEGLAGSLNVVLKEGARIRGGLAKAGALINEDGTVRPSGAIAYAGGDDDTSWWAGLNYQGRRNPKKKVSLRYDDEFQTFNNTELQSDTRDGVDISANGEFTQEFDWGRIRLNGLVIDTDRDEDETSLTYTDEAATAFDEAEIQAERIGQRTYAFGGDARFDAFGGQIDLDLGWNAYREGTTTSVDVASMEDLSDRELDEYVTLDIDDSEWDAGASYTFSGGDAWRVKAGVDFLDKTRDFAEVEYDISGGVVDDPDPEPGAVHQIKERRVDPYVRLTLEPAPGWSVDLGVRYETLKREVTSDLGEVSFDHKDLNPSAHITFKPTDVDQFRFSVARTVRRPSYDLLAPFIADEEPADEDALRGNPLLQNETSVGYDLGYEHRLGQRGIFGINAFYRDIDGLIETVDTGLEVNEDGDPPAPGDDVYNLFEARNVGKGKVWGVEVDYSAPLDFIGLPDTGLFFNYTWLKSETTDVYTGLERPFTNQPKYVYNIGFVHTLKAPGISFGASLYGRGRGFESGLDETVMVAYDADLEAFIEKRVGDKVVVRLAAMNLLDKEKRERFLKYDGDSVEEILDNRMNGNLDEGEIESERSGVLYQVTVRAAF
jgi:outer membrane receptor protein involved in Fe transport